MNNGVLLRLPPMPIAAMMAKSVMAAVQVAREAMRTGLRPHDWDRRPQIWLVRTTMIAATLDRHADLPFVQSDFPRQRCDDGVERRLPQVGQEDRRENDPDL